MSERHQLSQRVRIGISGLAIVFLLVIIGAAITRGAGPASKPAAAEAPTDPLADIGIAPGQRANEVEAAPTAPTAPPR